LKPGGIMFNMMGFAPGSLEAAEARGLRGAMVGQRPEPEQLRTLGNLIDEGQIKPVVSRVLPLSEVAQAQDSMALGHTRGKIILQMEED
jgi:NADPH:quinone reductase-like Zn-dependent oxidoreductase